MESYRSRNIIEKKNTLPILSNILIEAKEKTNYLEQRSNQKLKEQIRKRNILAKVKIEQMTRDANIQVKQYLIHNSIKATVSMLEKKLDTSKKQKLINQSIIELNSVLKN